jgi:hypothetical protein
LDAPPDRGGVQNEAGWEAQLAKLKAYNAARGDCNVPRGWAEDPQLGNWVSDQRKSKKTLDCGDSSDRRRMTAARAAKLEALGFMWHAPARGGLPNDTGWEAQLARLKAYQAEHGDCLVPASWAEDPKLGGWVSKQRVHKRRFDRGEPSEGMTAARVAKLEALGFAWEMSAAALSKRQSEGNRDDEGWEAQLAKLKAYKQEHGDCNVPTEGWAEDPPLGNWVSKQRTLKKALDRGEPSQGMTAARAAKLEALGFAWERSTAAQNNPHRMQAAEARTSARVPATKHATAAVEPGRPAEVGPAAAAARHPPGARVARVFGDGRWYEGTVLEAPWPAGHRWAHWRRVRFDDGATLDVDTDAGPLHFRSSRTRGEATKRPRAQPADGPAAGGTSGSSTRPSGPETLRCRIMRTRPRCVAHIGVGLA